MTHAEKLAKARARHGKAFAADSGSSYKPPARRILTDWTAERIVEAKKPKVFRPVDAKRRVA